MAKAKDKNKNEDKNELEVLPSKKEAKKKKKRKQKFLITLVLIGVIGGVAYNNKEALSQVPVIGQFFAPFVEEGDSYQGLSKEEAIAKLTETEQLLTQMTDEALAMEEEVLALRTRVETLTQYEMQYQEFELQKQTWNETLAKENPELYIEQFEKINPEQAEIIYAEIKGLQEWHKDYKKYANMVGSIEDSKAGEIFEALLKTDLTLVKQVFENIDAERQAQILSQMTTEGAAQIIKLISPENLPE